MAIETQSSIFVRAPVEKAFAFALGFDAPSIVRKRGPLPGVKSVSGTTGAWSSAGQKRKLTLTDGSGVEETLIEVGPSSYKYRVGALTGPFKFLVKEMNASFEVEPRKDGSMLTWTYAFTPASPLAAPVVSFIADALWPQWMDAALERMKDALEAK
ncbi:MAG: SRPBCC family protein [Parvularculaceae bacterium]|nr:SRPBCC family protein [Parvularculaceae bacterium]